MNRFISILKMLVIGVVTTGTVMLGACGGGGDAAEATGPVPQVLVTMFCGVTVGRFDGLIPILDDQAATVIVAVINSGIPVRAIRCGSLSPPSKVTSPAVQTRVLFMDVREEDVEKLKAFKFRVYGPEDQRARKLELFPCQ